jgi:predicted pyridoxine 5'-phosphate oxidase superfamily flavin-nucleotide-binding protein
VNLDDLDLAFSVAALAAADPERGVVRVADTQRAGIAAVVLLIAEWLDREAQREALRDTPFQSLGFVALFRRAAELRDSVVPDLAPQHQDVEGADDGAGTESK